MLQRPENSIESTALQHYFVGLKTIISFSNSASLVLLFIFAHHFCVKYTQVICASVFSIVLLESSVTNGRGGGTEEIERNGRGSGEMKKKWNGYKREEC
jgi:hypothetical protein